MLAADPRLASSPFGTILEDCVFFVLEGRRVPALVRRDLPTPTGAGELSEGIWPVVKLRVRSGESIQEAVRRFRKLCERSGLRKEMRRKAYYEKPSERRRREELKRLRKARQAARV